MKIAIHKIEDLFADRWIEFARRIKIKYRATNPESFSDRWIDYCQQKNIPYKLVNCYQSDIISQLSDCDALLWHHSQTSYKDKLFAKQLLFSVEQAGKKVFPNFNTGWHFDDKVGQKYLLESIGAPLVPSYVFYTKKEALEWVNTTIFPKVFKLRCGAGSCNVNLVKTKKEAMRLVNRSFGAGFSQFDRFANLKEKYRKYKEERDSLLGACKGLARLLIPTEFAKMYVPEKGYVYFQDFVPGNKFDVRLIIVGDRAYGMQRLNRKNDFRASGSESFTYEPIDNKTIEIAFDITIKLKLQSAAFDFIYSENGTPLIVEVSCFYGTKGSSKCQGYWTKDLKWHKENIDPQSWIIENLISITKE